MHLKIFLAVLFLLLVAYYTIIYSKETKEAAQLTGTYIKTGIRATKHSREMIKGSKEMMKEREKMASEHDDQ